MNLKSKTLMLIALPVLVILFGTFFLSTCKSPASPDVEDSLTTYTLTVSVGEGVTGSPTSGTNSYSEGQSVSYSYSLISGYMNLVVTLDDQQVEASGTITMDRNHTLNASAEEVPTFTLTDLAGTWTGTTTKSNVNITWSEWNVDSSGHMDCKGTGATASADLSINEITGIVTGSGVIALIAGNRLIIAMGSWNLQMSGDKMKLDGTLNVSYSGLSGMTTNLTKQ